MPGSFRVNLYRRAQDVSKEVSEKDGKFIGDGGEASEKHRRNIGETSEKAPVYLTETQEKILQYLHEDPALSAKKISEKVGISPRNIETNIKRLKDFGLLIRHGSPRTGYWEVVK